MKLTNMNYLSIGFLLGLAAMMLLTGCGSVPAPVQSLSYSGGPVGGPGDGDPRLTRHFASWAGTPYAYGGSRRSGVDCSGFVQLTYASLYRMQLPRTTSALRDSGREVSPRQLNAGDLVFFSVEDKDSHVGIYLGEGEFMHASSSRGVVRDQVFGPYWGERFSAAVRVLEQG